MSDKKWWALGMGIVAIAFGLVWLGANFLKSKTTGLDWFWGGIANFMLLAIGASLVLMVIFILQEIRSSN